MQRNVIILQNALIEEKYNSLANAVKNIIERLDAYMSPSEALYHLTTIYYSVGSFYIIFLEKPIPTIKSFAGLSTLQDCLEDTSAFLRNPNFKSVSREFLYSLSLQLDKDYLLKIKRTTSPDTIQDQPTYEHLLKEIQKLKEDVAELKSRSIQQELRQANRVGLFK